LGRVEVNAADLPQQDLMLAQQGSITGVQHLVADLKDNILLPLIGGRSSGATVTQPVETDTDGDRLEGLVNAVKKQLAQAEAAEGVNGKSTRSQRDQWSIKHHDSAEDVAEKTQIVQFLRQLRQRQQNNNQRRQSSFVSSKQQDFDSVNSMSSGSTSSDDVLRNELQRFIAPIQKKQQKKLQKQKKHRRRVTMMLPPAAPSPTAPLSAAVIKLKQLNSQMDIVDRHRKVATGEQLKKLDEEKAVLRVDMVMAALRELNIKIADGRKRIAQIESNVKRESELLIKLGQTEPVASTEYHKLV
jgi:hypothetical protein